MAGEQRDPVAQGPVVLDVGHRAGAVLHLDVRRAVPVGLRGGQPVRARVVGEHPPRRVRDREREAAAAAQHPGGLGDRVADVRHELQRPERAEHDVEAVVAERQRRRGAEDRRHRDPGLVVDAPRVLELAERQVDTDAAPAVAAHPA